MKCALLTMDNYLTAQFAQRLILENRDKISLIVLSERYGGKYGSLAHQTQKYIRKSGFLFSTYLSLVFLVYKPIEKILHAVSGNSSKTKIISSVTRVAQQCNIPIVYTKDVNDEKTCSKVREAGIDSILVAYFDQVLRDPLLRTVTKDKVVNIHSGDLPSWRGPFPIFWAMLHKGLLGTTVHTINDSQLDAGRMIYKDTFEFTDTADVLHEEIRTYRKFPEAAKYAFAFLSNPTAAETTEQGEGSYYSYPSKNDVSRIHHKLFTLRSYLSGFYGTN